MLIVRSHQINQRNPDVMVAVAIHTTIELLDVHTMSRSSRRRVNVVSNTTQIYRHSGRTADTYAGRVSAAPGESL